MPEELESPDLLLSDLSKLFSGLPRRYENRGVLGKGGMGIVFRAVDLHLERDVAIKLLFLNEAYDETAKKRFLLETKSLASLDHPNIVKLLSSGISDKGSLYQVMEFLNGKTLSAEIAQKGHLSSSRFFEIFKQVLSGLQHSHEHNLIHRDLKPSNIIICNNETDASSTVKIIDFGIARLSNPDNEDGKLTKTNALFGSPAYMSPEQCRGSQIDTRTDIYSLGCLMYEAIIGKPPFEGDSAMELAYKHVSSDWVHLEQLAATPESKEIGKLVDKCLSKKPEERPASAIEILEQISKIQKSQTGSLKLFAASKENQKRLLFLPISAGLISVLLLSCYVFSLQALQKQSKIESSKEWDKIKARNIAKATKDKQPNEQRIAELSKLRNETKNLESKFKQENNPLKKRALASEIIETGRNLAGHYQGGEQYDEAMKLLERLLEISKLIDDPDSAQSIIYKDMASTQLNNRKYAEAESYVNKAWAFIKKSQITGTYEAADVFCIMADIHIRKHELSKAIEEYSKASKIWTGDRNDIGNQLYNQYMNTNRERFTDSKVAVSQTLCLKLNEESFTSVPEQILAIKLNNAFFSYLLTRKAEFATDTYESAKKRLKQIPHEIPEFINLEKETSRLIYEYEKAMKQEAKQTPSLDKY